MINKEPPSKGRIPFQSPAMTTHQLLYVQVMINKYANETQLKFIKRMIERKEIV